MKVFHISVGTHRTAGRFARRCFAHAVPLAFAAISSAHAAIPVAERAVLLDLYNSAGGANWANIWNLNDIGNECNWNGITCDASGVTIEGINLDLNNLSGTLPASLNHLTHLAAVSMVENANLAGPIPPLTGLTHLTSIALARSGFTGSIPSLAGLISLQSVFFGYNQLSGPIPILVGLSNLNWFDVTYNQLSGSIPPLTGLTNLQAFLVTSNQLTGSIPDLSDQTGLEIDADNNLFSGSLPSPAQLAHLSNLFVEGNQFAGPIPELAGLINLVNFDVARNQLSGGIPALIGMTALQNIYVASNQLTGAIPSLAGLTNLRTFIADHNQLSGSIPAFTGLTNLSTVYLDHNQLTGHIPSLTGLTMLMALQVDHNQLSGTVPPLTGLRWLGAFFIGDNQLHGPAPAVPSPTALMPFGQGSLCPNYLDPVASTDWNTITHVTPWYLACTAQPVQAMTLSPAALSVEVETAGSSTSATLTIGNAGSGDLHWSLATADSDCSAPGSVPWIQFTSASSGTTAADSSSLVTLMFDAGTLVRGFYTASICVTNDNPTQPLVLIPVTFAVEQTAERIFSSGFD